MYETDHKEIDWDELKKDAVEKIDMLRLSWAASQSQAPGVHEKLVSDIYVPALRLLAEFCSCIEIDPDGGPDE